MFAECFLARWARFRNKPKRSATKYARQSLPYRLGNQDPVFRISAEPSGIPVCNTMMCLHRYLPHNLFLYFLIAVLIVLAASGIGVVFNLRSATQTILTGNLIPMQKLYEIRLGIIDVRRQFARAAGSSDPDLISASLKLIRADVSRIDSTWLSYFPSGVSSEREAQLADKLLSELSVYHRIVGEGIVLLEQQDQDALSQLLEHHFIRFNHFSHLIDELISTNLEQGIEISRESNAILYSVFIVMWVLLAVSLVVGFRLFYQRNRAFRDSRYQTWLAGRVIELTSNSVMITDSCGNILSVNPSFTEITGYDEAEVLGKNPRMLSSGCYSPDFYHSLWGTLIEAGRWEGEMWNRKKNGELYVVSQSIIGVPNRAGEYSNYVAVASDITQEYLHRESLKIRATHDVLTGLPNRLALEERLEHAISLAKRNLKQVAVLFIDLDGFKWINDTRGHAVGDDVLKVVAKRLKHNVRSSDTVARLGGDEFVVVLEDLSSAEHLKSVARTLVSAIGQPIALDGDVQVTPSIGISIYPEDATEADELLLQADSAMYRAKKTGKNNFCFYSEQGISSP